MTKPELDRWLESTSYNRYYWSRVYRRAKQLDSDGCTGVPDWLVWTCLEHDTHFRTRHFLYGEPITWRVSNYVYRVRIQQGSAFAGLRIPWVVDSLGFLSPISWWRWTGLVLFSRKAWNKWTSVEEEATGSKVITLCGPGEFAAEFQAQYKRLTGEGHIVLSFNFSDPVDGQLLDELQKRRIDISDEIFVVNPNGVIDDRTEAEIYYASTLGVPAVYLVPPMPENPENPELPEEPA